MRARAVPRALLGATRRLGVRIALFLGVALLPVGAVAVWQTLEVSRVAQQRSELTLLALTERAALTERQEIQRALGTAQALAGTVDALMAAGRCHATLGALVRAAPRYSYAGYVRPTGEMICSSDGRRHDFSSYPGFAEAIADPRPAVNVNRDAPLSGGSVMIASYPVVTSDGGGFAFVSLPHRRLGGGSLPPDIAASVELITVNPRGRAADLLPGARGASSSACPPSGRCGPTPGGPRMW